jgi:hypothetical protein
MPAALVGVKPPQRSAESESEERIEMATGRLGHAEFATWMGNALVLASIGTIALLVIPRTKQINAISDLFVAIALALAVWASYKFFFIKPEKRHHWTEWILFVIILATLASFIWLAILAT